MNLGLDGDKRRSSASTKFAISHGVSSPTEGWMEVLMLELFYPYILFSGAIRTDLFEDLILCTLER